MKFWIVKYIISLGDGKSKLSEIGEFRIPAETELKAREWFQSLTGNAAGIIVNGKTMWPLAMGARLIINSVTEEITKPAKLQTKRVTKK